MHLESSRISCIWWYVTLRSYRTLKMCSWCCESRGGLYKRTHIWAVFHTRSGCNGSWECFAALWMGAVWCSRGGLWGMWPFRGLKINFYTRELLLHVPKTLEPSALTSDRCGRQRGVGIRSQCVRAERLQRTGNQRLSDRSDSEAPWSKHTWLHVSSIQAAAVRGRRSSRLLQLRLLQCSSSWDLRSPCLSNEDEEYVKPAASGIPSHCFL